MGFENTIAGKFLGYDTLLGSDKMIKGTFEDPISAERPDYFGAAEKQGASGQQAINQQTLANRPGQTNAFGSSVNWTQGPNGQWQQSQSFGGPLAGAAQGLQGQVANSFASPFDNGSAARDQAINAAYGQATSRLDPQWNQREDQTRTRLMNQGLDPNSEAYANALSQFGRERNDAYGSAMNSAIGQGTAAQQATFQQNMMARNQPLQNLLGMQGLLGQQGFNAAGAYQPTQYLGAAMAQGNFDVENAKQQNENKADVLSGLGGLVGGVASMFSDERLKRKVERLGVEVLPGVPVATWEYWNKPGHTFIGVIAQDLEKVAPQYVHRDSSGFLKVDYSFAPWLGHEVSYGG